MGLIDNGYIDRAVLKTAVNSDGVTTHDTRLESIIAAVSRYIDQYCGRHFYVRTGTRYFTARSGSRLLLNADLLTITSLKTDDDGDRTYEDTWATTDYDLEPANALLESPPEPYYEIRTTPDGDYSFPSGVARGVEIVGTWGYYQVLSRSSATLSEDLTAAETDVDVSDGTQFAIGNTLLLGTEQMVVTAIATNTLTVQRGRNGTTAAAHSTAAVIDVFTFPIISEACLLQSIRLFSRRETPYGVVGSAEMGTVSVMARLDPDVRQLLAPFRHLVVA